MAFSNLRRRRLFKPRRHQQDSARLSARQPEDEVLTGWVETGTFAVSDGCDSTSGHRPQRSSTCSCYRSNISYDNCAVPADRPGWVVTRMPNDKDSLAQKEQHAQPHPPSQKDDNQEKQDRSGEVTEDKLQSMPGSFPVENEQASRPKGYKSWDRKGSVIWMDPYGRYPAQIATNR